VNDELFLNTLVAKAVTQTAKQVAKSQREYIPEDDLRQEAWIWVFAHSRKVHGWLDDDETASQKNAKGLLSSSLRVHLHKMCQKERMRRDGTKPDDYYHYSRSVVEQLLPDAFDSDAGTTTVSAAPHGEFVRSSKQPSEGFEYHAMLSDIRAGLASLPPNDKRLLWDRFAFGGSDVKVMAASAKVGDRTMRYRLSRAINRLIRSIGGEQPRRMRPRRSNAAAQVETRRIEEGA